MLQWNRRSALGLSPAEVRARLPACYSQEFDNCLVEFTRAKNAGTPPSYNTNTYCKQFEAVIHDTSEADWDAAMKLVPYCPAPAGASVEKKGGEFPWVPLAVVGALAGTIAIVVTATGARF